MKLSKNEKYLNLTKIFFMEPIINIIVEEWLYELFWPKRNLIKITFNSNFKQKI